MGTCYAVAIVRPIQGMPLAALVGQVMGACQYVLDDDIPFWLAWSFLRADAETWDDRLDQAEDRFLVWTTAHPPPATGPLAMPSVVVDVDGWHRIQPEEPVEVDAGEADAGRPRLRFPALAGVPTSREEWLEQVQSWLRFGWVAVPLWVKDGVSIVTETREVSLQIFLDY